MFIGSLFEFRVVAALVFALAIGGVGVPGAAFGQSEGGTQQRGERPRAVTSGSATMVSAEQLSDDPEEYYGKTVTVEDDVADVIGGAVFTIDDGEFLGTSPDILVFAPNAEAIPNEESRVTVTGTVRAFSRGQLEREWGWGWGAYPWGVGDGYGWYGAGYSPDYWMRYENRPYILAHSIKTASGRELVSGDSKSGGSSTVGTAGGGREKTSTVTKLSELTAPARPTRARVQLADVKVERVTSRHGFWLAGPNGHEVFVALDDRAGQVNLNAGDIVSIAGTARPVPSDKTEINASKWGLGSEDLTKLLNTHVIIRAHAIRVGRQDQSK